MTTKSKHSFKEGDLVIINVDLFAKGAEDLGIKGLRHGLVAKYGPNQIYTIKEIQYENNIPKQSM